MRHFRDWSITTRLFALTIGASTIALALSCTFFLIDNIYSFRSEKAKQLETIADMLEYHCGNVLETNSLAEGLELLGTLRNTPSVKYACLLDKNGDLVAEHVATETSLPPDTKTLHQNIHGKEEQSQYVDQSRYEIFQPVEKNGQRIGTLYLRAQTSAIGHQTRLAAQVTLIVAIVSFLASLLFTWIMQRTISRPILDLVKTAQAISEQKDYSIRVKQISGRNELAVLTRAFNEMLREIQVFHDRLKGTHDDLEMRIGERTVQLRNEVSRHEHTQEELVEAKELAEMANLAKSEFLANMSHEIRTPLTAIMGFTDLLRKGAYDDDKATQSEQLNLVYRSSQHLLELINDILDLSKVEAGSYKPEPVDCSPHEIVSEVIAVQQVAAAQKELSLKYEWSTPVPKTVHTDPSRLRQIMINLIGNAIKFTKSGGVTITMGTTEKSGQELLAVRVQDTGIGIPEHKLQQIFEPFVQADTSVTRQFGGTGLGLSICRRIAKMLGGRLTVKSKPGNGSTFTVMIHPGNLDGVERLTEIPDKEMHNIEATNYFGSTNHKSQTNEVTLTPPEPSSTSLKEHDLQNIRILLVEDGETNRKLLSTILGRAGAKVTLAENGKIGFEYATQKLFDVILMDMQMPVVDGYTATKKIREFEIDTPVVALTAHAMVGDAQQCYDAGCNEYLSKPIEEELLCKTVRRVVDNHHEKVLAYGTELDPENSTAVDAAFEQSVEFETTRNHTPIQSTLPVDDLDFRHVVIDFIIQLHEWIDSLKEALVRRDLKTLGVLSHCLKGSAGMAGFNDFTKPATELGKAVHYKDWDRIREKVNEIESLGRRIQPPEVRS